MSPYLSLPYQPGVLLLQLTLHPPEALDFGEGVAQPTLRLAEIMPRVRILLKLLKPRLPQPLEAVGESSSALFDVRRHDLDAVVGRALLHFDRLVAAAVARFLFDSHRQTLESLADVAVVWPEVLYRLRFDDLTSFLGLILSTVVGNIFEWQSKKYLFRPSARFTQPSQSKIFD